MTYETGQLATSYLWLLIPTAATLLLWLSVWVRRDSYRRRFQGRRLFWEMWGSTIVLSAILFGLFYWYLYWRPFYAVTVQPDGDWTLVYALPTREVHIPAADIAYVTLQPEELFPVRNKGHRQYVLVTLVDGRTYTSAPMGPGEAPAYLAQLRQHLWWPDGWRDFVRLGVIRDA